jgi:glycosyltransferase involved in cell wall biosynthesis
VGFWRERPEVIHARTFVGGLMGLLLRVLLGVPLIYHNEGFWPDEQVEGGFWKSGSWTYRVCKALETVIYGRADGLVLLSKRSFPFVQALPAVRRRQPPTAVVPSCVDLGRFVPVPRQTSRPLRLIYVGNLGGRYPMEPMVGFLNALRRLEPDATVTILSQSDLENVRTRLAALGLPESAWTLSRARHSDVPEYLNRAHAGLAVRSPGIGAFSSSPTKIGEYWASGLPVVTTPGLGDTDALIEERRVGVILRHADADAYETAARELITLLADPDLTTRCRQAAEDCYSLERGVDTQLALYRSVLDHARPVALTCDR